MPRPCQSQLGFGMPGHHREFIQMIPPNHRADVIREALVTYLRHANHQER